MTRTIRFSSFVLVVTVLAAAQCAQATEPKWFKVGEVVVPVQAPPPSPEGIVLPTTRHIAEWINRATFQKQGVLRTFDERVVTDWTATTKKDPITFVARFEANFTVDCHHRTIRTNSIAVAQLTIDDVAIAGAEGQVRAQIQPSLGKVQKLETLGPDEAWVCSQ